MKPHFIDLTVIYPRDILMTRFTTMHAGSNNKQKSNKSKKSKKAKISADERAMFASVRANDEIFRLLADR
jgi:hypothetical protein